jgi:3-hydroxyacyl-[acyl-carrier-protein] dehydratase
VRFVFVDRVRGIEPGAAIEVVKNVSAAEDVFEDHFPGFPVFPGCLVVEVFEQASQLLVAITYGFARVGRLAGVSRVGFRHLVRPGDQLCVRCEARTHDDVRWRLACVAAVDGKTVASGTLDLDIVETGDEGEAHEHARRLQGMTR